MKNIAIYPGSFDPITNGHVDIIKKSAKLFEEVYVVVANNRDKNHFFSIKERTKMVEKSVGKLSNVKVIAYEGIISDLANELKATVLVRGIRDNIDMNYEFSIEQFTRSTAPNLETIYFSPKPGEVFTSSSLVRNLIKMSNLKSIKPYVVEKVYKIIKSIMKERQNNL